MNPKASGKVYAKKWRICAGQVACANALGEVSVHRLSVKRGECSAQVDARLYKLWQHRAGDRTVTRDKKDKRARTQQAQANCLPVNDLMRDSRKRGRAQCHNTINHCHWSCQFSPHTLLDALIVWSKFQFKQIVKPFRFGLSSAATQCEGTCTVMFN